MFDGLINNLPMELHLPSYPQEGEYVPNGSFNNTNKYSYAGPGTKFLQRVQEGYKGINDLDKATMVHDYFYWKYKDRDTRTKADRLLAGNALKIAQNHNKNGYERAMAAFVYKTFTEGGIADKLQGKGYELRERKPIAYSETKQRKVKKDTKPLKAKKKEEKPAEQSKVKFQVLADELHKPARKRFPRRRVIVQEIDETWGMDLVFMEDLAKQNNQHKYILTIIDCFSKHAWAVPLKTKDAKTVFDAFISVINSSKRKPKNIWVDQGSEFYNAIFTNWLKNNNVTRYSTYENFHNPIIERFNRTLKTKMWKQFTLENTRNWFDMLENLLEQYNNSKHRMIGMTPKEASDPKNRDKVHKKLYPPGSEIKPLKPNYSVGDVVRISRLKGDFEKGFHPSWSEELFKVVKINETFPRTYKLEALDGESVLGSFYEQEMQHSKQHIDNVYRVEKILKRKKVKGKEMVQIKWAGYDKPTWEYAENVLN